MHMVNDKGEAVYYNLVRKNNKDYWRVQGIGPTVVYGRDRERRKSRHFTPGTAGGALPCPAWFPARLTVIFPAEKNAKEKHPHERIAH